MDGDYSMGYGYREETSAEKKMGIVAVIDLTGYKPFEESLAQIQRNMRQFEREKRMKNNKGLRRLLNIRLD